MYIHPNKGQMTPPVGPAPLPDDFTSEEYEAWKPLRDAWLEEAENYERERMSVMGPRTEDPRRKRHLAGKRISEIDAICLYGDEPLRRGNVWNGYDWVSPEVKARQDKANADFTRQFIYLLIFIIVVLVLALART